MRTLTLALCAAALAAGCNNRSTSNEQPAAPPPVAVSNDAAPPPVDAAAQGNETGLGAAGEHIEVATEALLPAQASGALPASAVVDERGLVERVDLPGGDVPRPATVVRRCGTPARAKMTR